MMLSLLIPMLAYINGWELVLIFAVIFILFGGLGEGFLHFRKSLDRQAHAAGESFGGIYGRPAAEALTPDNQTAEIYDPAVFHRKDGARFFRWLRLWRAIWHSVIKLLKAKS